MSKTLMVCAGSLLAGAYLAIAGTGLAMAQNKAPSTHLRGEVATYSGTSLQVRSREGKLVDVTLAEGWKIASVAQASLEQVKPGDFVGIASMPNASSDRALEVLILPPALKGAGEGSYSWDLKPHSSMTNASVTNLVKGLDGRTISLSYSGGQQKKITIPEGTPVVTLAPATPDDLTPGAAVFIPAEPAGDGKVSAHQVIVGKNGVVPPM